MFRKSARAEVVAALLDTGGAVEDADGRSVSALADRLRDLFDLEREPTSFSELLKRMDDAHEVEREVRARRTYRISVSPRVHLDLINEAVSLLLDAGRDPASLRMLVDSSPVGGSAGPLLALSAPAVAQSAKDRAVAAELGVSPREVRRLREELEAAQKELRDAQQQLAVVAHERDVARADYATLEQDVQELWSRIDQHRRDATPAG